jgi:hypothetical protein
VRPAGRGRIETGGGCFGAGSYLPHGCSCRAEGVVDARFGQWGNHGQPIQGVHHEEAGAAANPEFKGTALFVETHDFVRKPEDSPCPGHGHHEFANAETYFLVGKAMGEGMKRLLLATSGK